MANATSTIELTSRPLQTADAAGLFADIEPTRFFQPTLLMESDFDSQIVISASGLTTAADTLEINFAPDSDYEETAWLPIAFRGFWYSPTAGTPAFWDTEAAFSVSGINPEVWNFDSCTMDTARLIQDAGVTTNVWMQTVNPVFHGMPPRPQIVDGGSIALNRMGSFTFTVATFDAPTLAALAFHADCRWLGFPRASIRSGGFYTPRMYFQPN